MKKRTWILIAVGGAFLLILIALLSPSEPSTVSETKTPTTAITSAPTIAPSKTPEPTKTPLPESNYVIRDFMAGVYDGPNFNLDEAHLLGQGDPIYIPNNENEFHCEQPNADGVILTESTSMQMCLVDFYLPDGTLAQGWIMQYLIEEVSETQP